MAKAPILGPAYVARSKTLAQDRCINLFPESAPSPPAKETGALFGCPGRITKVTLATGPVHGLIAANSKFYAVGGSRLYEISSAYVATDLGYVGASARVSMATNGVDLTISTGYRYVFATATLSQITDADFAFGTLQFQDGYYLTNDPGTGRIRISGPYDGSAYDSLDFTTAEGAPDNVIAHISDHRQWWVFGTESCEIYENIGSGDFPFVRIGGGFIPVGIAAAGSLCKFDNSLAWLGRDEKGQGIVYKANGYIPQRISTHGIEHAIAGYSDISDAYAYTYQMEGHVYYVLTFPTANATWEFDAATQLWHELAWREASDNSLNRIRDNAYCFCYQKHLVGDHTTGAIYALDMDTYTDGGEVTRKWLRSFRLASAEGKRIRLDKLEFAMEVGVGLDGVGQGTDPKIMLRLSKDGGNTWGNERQLSIGKIGEYGARVIARRLGTARDWVVEISGTDPVKTAIVGAYYDATVLAS